MRNAILVVILLGCFAPGSANAQWPDLSTPSPVTRTGANDVAVIVAIDDYLLLPDVDGAIDNANDWETFLRNDLGVRSVHVLANQEATRESMLKFARLAASDVGDGGRVWWVFIGHGAPATNGKDGLLVGMDAQQTIESLESRSLRRSELLQTFSSVSTVLVLDACFSGRTPDGEALAAGVQPVVAVEALTNARESVVLSAAKPNEVAGRLPGARRPAFSYLVLGALRGWADDGDGAVTASEALYFTRRELRGVKGRQQTPQLEGDGARILTEGADEPMPEVVVPKMSPEDDPVVESSDSASGSEADRRLRYMAQRIDFDGRQFRQNGQVLYGVPFYNEVGRPDLSEEFRGHTPWMWGLGAGLLVGGIAAVAWGLSGDTSGRTLGGFLGGFFTVAAGTSLLTIGIMLDDHPVSMSQREALAREYNAELREKLGLGPEVEPVQQRTRTPFNIPLSHAAPRQYGAGISLSF